MPSRSWPSSGSRGREPRRPAQALETARLALGLSVGQLWLDYVGLGGNRPLGALKGFLDGRSPLSDHDHDMVTQALNEHFADRAANHPLAYADELPSGAGAALTRRPPQSGRPGRGPTVAETRAANRHGCRRRQIQGPPPR